MSAWWWSTTEMCSRRSTLQKSWTGICWRSSRLQCFLMGTCPRRRSISFDFLTGMYQRRNTLQKYQHECTQGEGSYNSSSDPLGEHAQAHEELYALAVHIMNIIHTEGGYTLVVLSRDTMWMRSKLWWFSLGIHTRSHIPCCATAGTYTYAVKRRVRHGCAHQEHTRGGWVS